MEKEFWKDYFELLGQAVQRLQEILHHLISRDFLKKAYQFNLIDDEKIWLQMMHDRNRASHVYKQEIANRFLKISLPNPGFG